MWGTASQIYVQLRAYVVDSLLSEFVIADVLSVSQYASRLGAALRDAGGATLEGEVQNAKVTPGGMLFFDLTDGDSKLSCKVFRRELARLAHRPATGDLVRVEVERPDFYPANGSLSLIVCSVELAGIGELLRRRQELLARLAREGLCDPSRRRPLPAFPVTVGVVAGEGSHGMADAVKAITDRWPATHIITYPTLVQGKAAPRQIINALATFQERSLADVIIVTRGGGSVQDLACFDDERLCRAIFACEIPVVCAIGHTENDPVCNHVTWAGYTPSRSAELVVPSLVEVRQNIQSAAEMINGVPTKLSVTEARVQAVAARVDARPILAARFERLRHASASIGETLVAFLRTHDRVLAEARAVLTATPRRAMLELSSRSSRLALAGAALNRTAENLAAIAKQTTDIGDRMTADSGRRLTDAQRTVAHLEELIAAHDFRRRGWLLASKAGKPVRSVEDLEPGDAVDLQLHDGSVSAVIE